MRKEGGDWVELGLGLEPVARDVNLILAPVDEICCDHLLFPSVLREVVHKAQANVALQCVAVGTAGGLADVLPVSVNGLSPPRPEVQVCVVVIQDEHSEAFIHPVLPLMQQGVSTDEIHPLGERGNPELSSTLCPLPVSSTVGAAPCHCGGCDALPPPLGRLWETCVSHQMKTCIHKLPSENFCNITDIHVSFPHFIHRFLSQDHTEEKYLEKSVLKNIC